MIVANGVEQIFRNAANPVPEWMPQEYLLKSEDAKNNLPTAGVNAGARAYTADGGLELIFDGETWKDAGEKVHTILNTIYIQDGQIVRSTTYDSETETISITEPVEEE